MTHFPVRVKKTEQKQENESGEGLRVKIGRIPVSIGIIPIIIYLEAWILMPPLTHFVVIHVTQFSLYHKHDL
jgi:hypothetical protein